MACPSSDEAGPEEAIGQGSEEEEVVPARVESVGPPPPRLLKDMEQAIARLRLAPFTKRRSSSKGITMWMVSPGEPSLDRSVPRKPRL